MGSTVHRLDLPWLAPPLNLNDHVSWPVRAKVAKDVRNSVGWLARAAKLGTHDRVRVTLHYRPARKNRRDEDNLVGTYKPACDGLVDARLVVDDTPQHMEKRMPVLHEPRPGQRGGELWLEIQVLGTEPEIDWRRVAIQVARYGGSYHGLSTPERDALEGEVRAADESAWGTKYDRTSDAASGLEGR